MMIKNYCALVIIIHFFSISSAIFSMENQTRTVALLDPNHGIVGTDKYCALIENIRQESEMHVEHHLTNLPTYNIICDKKNLRAGVFTKELFTVYDIKTKNPIWSRIINSENCSAAFSPIEKTIFFCQDGHLISDNGISMILPYVGKNSQIDIQCHPKRKELLYTYSNRGLKVYSFAIKTSTKHYPKVMDSDIIVRAVYSQKGNHIALLTDKHTIFIYNPITDTTISVSADNCKSEGFSYPIFIDNSTLIAFVCNQCKKIHCWDFKKKQLLVKLDLSRHACIENSNPCINTFDFFRDGSQYMYADLHGQAIKHETNYVITNHIHDFKQNRPFVRYCLLNMYEDDQENVLPLDIVRLIITQLSMLYKG